MIKWTSCLDGLPPFNRKCGVWCEGTKEHSGASFHRNGFALMTRWDDRHTVSDGWSNLSYQAALRDLDADILTVTHWVLIEAPLS